MPSAPAVAVPVLSMRGGGCPAADMFKELRVCVQVDMNGKRNPWEGVNLLPFIDQVLQCRFNFPQYSYIHRIPEPLVRGNQVVRHTQVSVPARAQ